MRKTQIETMETEVNAELDARAEAEKSINGPIYDGVVDVDRYLASSPKILWILKEPYDEPDGIPGGGWSVTEHILAAGKFRNKRPFAPIAYVAYAVFNGYSKYSEMDYVTEDPLIVDSVKNIAYININKMPGKSASDAGAIASYYLRNRELLKKQIDIINPDIVIAGNILHLFYEDFGITQKDFQLAGSAWFCQRNGRLYINAYHPSYWSCKEDKYVNDIVAIIKEHSPAQPPQSPRQS